MDKWINEWVDRCLHKWPGSPKRERAESEASLSPVLGLEDWKILSEFTHTHTAVSTLLGSGKGHCG